MLRYYAVITVTSHRYTVSMHTAGNYKIGKSVTKNKGNVRDFQSAWRMVALFVITAPFSFPLLFFRD